MTDRVARVGGPDQVFRLIYRSHIQIPQEDRKVVLGEIFSTARSNNKGKQITGALLVSGEWFAQVLEGEEKSIKELYDRIEQDPRHDQIQLLEMRPTGDRVFSRWAMARVSDDGETDIPLIAHRDGISPAAGHKTTPEQEAVLKVMREATTAEKSQA
jgi:hypothetical protein